MSSPDFGQQLLHDRSFYAHDFDMLPAQEWPDQDIPGMELNGLRLVASEGEILEHSKRSYHLGETNLPIANYRNHIVDTIRDNQKTIITADTGSGKSTQLGLYLLEAGAPIVYITQPRILAARELLGRARHNLGSDHEHLAGYLTGDQEDSDCPEGARLVYVTEDLLFKMANRGMLEPDAIVINDEAHERTAGTIMLLGLMKELLNENPAMRLVVSSATIDKRKFSTYLDDAPVLDLPGRTFPIDDRETKEGVAQTMRHYMRRPHEKNVLAFEPGATRLKKTAAKAGSRLHDHKVHLLYGDQSPREQKAALNPADKHHIVSTRVGETSITPENKDVVVDSGLSNLGGYEAGRRTLSTVMSSKATMRQRRGRVGRTRPGIYVVAQPDDAPPSPDYKNRPDYDPPEIENSSVASYLLELASQGRSIEDLKLLESPTTENLFHDKTLLARLGAAALFEEGHIIVPTDIGLELIDLNLNPPEARMVVEARKYNTAEDGTFTDAVRLQVAAAVAVQQVHGILDVQQGTRQKYRIGGRHQDALSIEEASDLIFQLDVFTALFAKQQKFIAENPDTAEEQFELFLQRREILPNRYYKSLRTFKELCRREDIDPTELRIATRAERADIVACQISGADELFLQRGKQTYLDIRGERRQLGSKSTINPLLGSLVIGTAFNYRGIRKNGRYEKRFVASGSTVTAEQLAIHAIDRITRQRVGHGVNKAGKFVEKQALYFDDEMQFGVVEAQNLSPDETTRRALITAMMTGVGQSIQTPREKVTYRPGTPRAERAIAQLKRAHSLAQVHKADLQVTQRYNQLIEKIIEQSIRDVPLDVTDPQLLDEAIPVIYTSKLVRPSRYRKALRTEKVSPVLVEVTAEHGISNSLNEHTVDEARTETLEVRYRNGVAYVTIPRDLKFTIKPSDFRSLAAHHDVKIQIGSEKYQPMATAFGQIEEQRPEHERKRAERAARRAVQVSVEARGRAKRATAERKKQEVEKARLASITEQLVSRRPTSNRKRSKYLKAIDRAKAAANVI